MTSEQLPDPKSNNKVKNQLVTRAQDLTSGPVLSRLLALAGPVVLANLLQTAYQFIDTVWVGRIGPTAVAAVSLSFPLLFLMISIGSGLAIAGTILVAQYQGRQDYDRVNLVSGQTVTAMFFLSLLIAAGGYAVAESLIGLMVRNADNELIELAVAYLQWTFLALPTLFVFVVFQSLMRGVGDVITPLYIVSSTVVLNFFLDPIFIFVFDMGVVGAAVATFITQLIAAIAGVWLLFSGRAEIKLKTADLHPDWKLLKSMFLLGVPSSIEQSSRALGVTMIAFLVADYPTSTVAAYGIGSRVLGFVVVPALGLSSATTSIVGQNIGAERPDRALEAVKLSAWIGFLALTLVGALCFFLAVPIARFFVPSAPDVIAESGLFLRIVAPTFGLIAIQQVLNGAFRGSGSTMISMVLSIISLWVLRFPAAYILSDRMGLGAVGIWWSYPFANVIAAALAIAWYAHGGWIKKRLIDDVEEVQEGPTSEGLVELGV